MPSPSIIAMEEERKVMRVYVGGSTKETDRVNRVQQMVRDAGHEISFDWTGAEGEIRTDGSWCTAPEAAQRIAKLEVDACRTSDLSIILFPLGPTNGLGCWIEMGAALSARKNVIVVAPQRESVFWYHPGVTVVDSLEDLRSILIGDATS